MRVVFADTFYFLALLNQRDTAHERAVEASRESGLIVTTEFVLVELADAQCKPRHRDEVLTLCRIVETDATFRLIRASTELIRLGKELFRSRGDKEWPLTDCISFVVMLRLNQRGVRETVRPSGHNIRSGFTEISSGGSISSNVIEEAEAEDMLKFRNNAANDNYTLRCKEAGLKIHPARFPAALPEFFVKLLTDESDIVYDPFAGSNTPGAVAEKLERRWLASENVQDYLEASKFRFE